MVFLLVLIGELLPISDISVPLPPPRKFWVIFSTILQLSLAAPYPTQNKSSQLRIKPSPSPTEPPHKNTSHQSDSRRPSTPRQYSP
ncbi:MAG: hypothetical protein ACI81P_002217 [Neolewinella sp.]|jgi:hypothetical protein